MEIEFGSDESDMKDNDFICDQKDDPRDEPVPGLFVGEDKL
jgi:hypothetical protein